MITCVQSGPIREKREDDVLKHQYQRACKGGRKTTIPFELSPQDDALPTEQPSKNFFLNIVPTLRSLEDRFANLKDKYVSNNFSDLFSITQTNKII